MGRLRLLVGISVFWLALSMVSDGLTTLALPRRLLDLADETRRATVLGLLTFAGLVVGMLVQPVAGLLSDRLRGRWGRRGTIALGVAFTLPALALFGAGRSLPALAIAYVLIQATTSAAQAAQQGFIPDLVPAERRGTAAGLKGFMDVGGALLGFVLLGQLLGAGRMAAALFGLAAAMIITLGFAAILVREPAGPPQGGEHMSVAGAYRLDLGRHRAFAWVVLARFLFLLGTYAVGRFFLFFVAHRLNLDPERAAAEAGLLLAGLTLVTAAAALPAGWAADRLGRLPVMAAGALASAAGTLLLALAGTAPAIFLCGLLMALGSAAFAGANWALTADLAPPAEAGRFLGLANIGTAGAAAAAGLLGPLIDRANAASPGGGYVALCIAATLASLDSIAPLWPLWGLPRPDIRPVAPEIGVH